MSKGDNKRHKEDTDSNLTSNDYSAGNISGGKTKEQSVDNDPPNNKRRMEPVDGTLDGSLDIVEDTTWQPKIFCLSQE